MNKTTAIAAVLILTTTCGLAWGMGSIRLLDQAGCESVEVTLSCIAELQGDQALSLADTVITRFRLNDRELTVTLDTLRDVLCDAGVNWSKVSLKGFTRCRVSRLAAEDELPTQQEGPVLSNIEGELDLETTVTLKDRILEMMERELCADRHDLQLTYSRRDEELVSRSILTGQYELEPVVGVKLGRLPVTIRRYEDGRAVETFTVNVEVRRRVLAVVATRTIGKGDLFNADNLTVTEVWLDSDRGEPVDDPELIRGQVASTVLRESTVIYPSHVRSPLLVKRGELVTVRCFSGVLVVRTVVRAMENGALDDLIQVRNESTRETFNATVTGRRQAVIELNREKPDVELSSAVTGGRDR